MKKISGGFNNIANIGNSANKSDTYMILFFLFILLVFIIFMVVRYYQYRKLVCPEGKKTTFVNFAFTNQKCEIVDVSGTREMSLIPGTATNVMMSGKITPQNVSDEIALPMGKNEVFHIANQDYTYEQARCKCASYGARLATKEEIIDAYNKGADWCSYGWTEGQRAFYPTQKCSWDKLQTGPENMRNLCGLPGVNGGFFPNSNMKFGATCYGAKPKGQVVKPKVATCTTGVCDRPGNEDASTRKATDDIVAFNSDQWNE